MTAAISVADRFQAAITKIEPTEADRQYAITKHTLIRNALDAHKLTEKTFLTGSYARHTAVAPLHDVDMFMVVGSEGEGDASKIHARIKGIIDSELPSVHTRLQTHSVGLEFKDEKPITFDVVPALEKGDDGNKHYMIARRKLGWIRTNPVAAKDATSQANDASDGRLLPLIKMMKHWNQYTAMREGKYDKDGDLVKPFKSFHLEVLCLKYVVQTENYDPRKGLYGLFCHLAASYRLQVTPPGGGTRLDTYLVDLEEPHPHDLGALLLDATRLAHEARWFESQGKIEDAHACWRKLLGNVY